MALHTSFLLLFFAIYLQIYTVTSRSLYDVTRNQHDVTQPRIRDVIDTLNDEGWKFYKKSHSQNDDVVAKAEVEEKTPTGSRTVYNFDELYGNSPKDSTHAQASTSSNIPERDFKTLQQLRLNLAIDEVQLREIYAILRSILSQLQEANRHIDGSLPEDETLQGDGGEMRKKRGPQGQLLANYSSLLDRVGNKLNGMSKRMYRRGVVNDYI